MCSTYVLDRGCRRRGAGRRRGGHGPKILADKLTLAHHNGKIKEGMGGSDLPTALNDVKQSSYFIK